MDPVESGLEPNLPVQSADIITLSHDHSGPEALEGIKPGYRLINGPGEYEIREVYIRGYRTMLDNGNGATVRNTAYVVEIEDLVVCHLGHFAQVPSEEQAADFGSVDVLLMPIGGGPTIDAAKAAEVIGQLEPSMVIPMHYRPQPDTQERDPLERFLKELGVTEAEPRDRISVKKSDLGETLQVVVLRP